LYAAITEMASNIEAGRRDFTRMIADAKAQLIKTGLKPDYIEVRASNSLLQPGHEDKELVILAAAFLGKTRLIDNIQLQV
jgi:pantoate--beta-alanine ligase